MATVDLRAVARAEWEATQGDRTASALAVLGGVLGADYDDAGDFDVVDVIDFAGGYTVVFKDAVDVHLAVSMRDTGADRVMLAKPDGSGGWIFLGDEVQDLAHLWTLIEEHLPPVVTYPQWEAQVAYAVGDRVTYNGLVYRCIQAHTSQVGWEPNNVPALWTRVV